MTGWINIGGIRDRTGLLGILFRTKWGTYLTSSFFGPSKRVTGKYHRKNGALSHQQEKGNHQSQSIHGENGEWRITLVNTVVK